MARAPDGRVVFVPYTAPGDLVRAQVVEERRRFLRARALELRRPGPGRTDPLCPVFGSCGGCTWQHLTPETQLEAKRAILRDAFARIAHLAAPADLAVRASASPYGYRSRARVQVREGKVGFLRRRSHGLCATSRCPVLAPELDDALAGLAAKPPARDGEWEIAAGSDGAVLATPLPAGPGAGSVELRVGSDVLRVSAGVFAQANASLRESLVTHVLEEMGEGEAAVELHAGAGLFTLGLARRFSRVTAVESDPAAAADLEHNLVRAGHAAVTAVTGPAETWLEEARAEGDRPDALLLDPPRSGLGPVAAEALARLATPRIVYVSCDPATLARDVGVLVDRGYELTALMGFDLFPQTAHVEAVATLRRPGD